MISTSPTKQTQDKESTVGTISIETVMCGNVEFDDTKIIHFDGELLGFADRHRYALLQTSHGPLFWLQCIDDSKLALCVLDPFEAGIDPDMSINQSDMDAIGAQSLDDIKVYTVVVLDEDPTKIRTNLRAPILVCNSTNRACQVILDDQSLPVQLFLKDLVPESAP